MEGIMRRLVSDIGKERLAVIMVGIDESIILSV